MTMNLSQYKFKALFILILAVLLPHTAWWFEQFEPDTATWVMWAAAVAFEGAVYAFTEKLADRIGAVSSRVKWHKRLRIQYFHPYSLGLLLVTLVSIMANRSHAIVFGNASPVFDILNMSVEQGSLWAGAVLPVCSLLFAWVLSQENLTEHEQDERLIIANKKIREQNKTIQELNAKAQAANAYAFLGSVDKTEVILGVRSVWPGLNQAAVAEISGASKSHVSTTLKANTATAADGGEGKEVK